MKNGAWLAMGSVAALGALSRRKGSVARVDDKEGRGLYGTFHLGSSRIANSEGLMRMAQDQYLRDPDWGIDFLSKAFNLNPTTAEAVVSGFTPYMKEENEEGPVIVFTFGPPGSKGFHPRPPIYRAARNFFQQVKHGKAWSRDPFAPSINSIAEEAQTLEAIADSWMTAIQAIPEATQENSWGKYRGKSGFEKDFWLDQEWSDFPYETMAQDDELAKRIAAAVADVDLLLIEQFPRHTQGWQRNDERREATQEAMKWASAGKPYHKKVYYEFRKLAPHVKEYGFEDSDSTYRGRYLDEY